MSSSALTYLEELKKVYKEPQEIHRKKALEKLTRLGFPDRTVEEYRKVVLAPLLERSFTLGEEDFKEEVAPSCATILMRNGKLVSEKSSVPSPLILSNLEDAFVIYASFMRNRLERRIEEEKDFFALATESFQERGIFLYIPPKTEVSLPIHIVHQYLGKNKHSASKIQIVVGKGSSCSIIYESTGDSYTNSVALELFDIVVEKGGCCQITDLSFMPKETVSMRTLRGLVKGEGKLTFISATKGSSLYRLHYQAELVEEGASADLQGVWYLNDDRKAYFSGEVKHLAPHTTSNQHFKGVLLDKSKATFTGKIFVASVAQKTQAYQLNNNLILGDGATVFTKPHLEIFADDVKASHGATVSQLSAEELFYMRSRGYKESLAREVLMRGFLEEIITSIPHPEIANKVRGHYVF